MDFKAGGNRWGAHRVLKPEGSLPQAADRLDAGLPLFENELLVRVESLQIDSASFHQLQLGAQNAEEVGRRIARIVEERGKMHNPITNSGGVFLGKIAAIGPKHPLKAQLKEGDSVTSLVSLTLTPLRFTSNPKVDIKTGRITVEGEAIIFESGLIAKMPSDLPEGVALAALDVCGAPAQAKRHVQRGEKVLVLGLGKAGRTIALQAQLNGAVVYGVDAYPDSVNWCKKNLTGHFEVLNATDAVTLSRWIEEQTRGSFVDMAIHATNVDNTEMAAILSCRDGGRVLFFGMHTSFQKAVLGAEGVGRDVTLLMGSGYVPGHDELMLNLLRKNKPLRQWFEEKFGK